MKIEVQDDFLPARLADFCARDITRRYKLREFKSRSLHDSTKNKNNKFFNRLSARILEDLGHEDPLPDHGCVVNSFSTKSIPLGPHDYRQHNGREINRHIIYFLSEGANFSGGSLFYSAHEILPLQLRQESKYHRCHPKHNRLVSAPPKVDRFSDTLLESDAPIIQVNVFCFDE
jgi:hypothetical protein